MDGLIIDSHRSMILLVTCCIICYSESIRNDYCLDDDYTNYNNVYVQQGIKGIPDILTHPYYSSTTLSFDYRPIATITFAVERQLFGYNPHEAHAFNLILYIICILLVFNFLTAVLKLDVAIAFCVSLFFAVHPAHIEVVASIKNREEIMSFIFCFLAFFIADRVFVQKSALLRILYSLLVGIFILLSFMSKLTSLPMVAILALLLYFRGQYKQRALSFGLVGFIALISMGYAWQIFHIANRPIYDLENPLVMTHDISIKVGTTLASLLFYFKFMCLPYPFSFFYGYNTIPLTAIDDPVAVLSLFIHAALLFYGLYCFFKKDIIGFFILSYFIAMSVYSNIVMYYTGIVSERALFFPSLWFIGALCTWLYKRVYFKPQTANISKLILLVCAAAIFVIYGVLIINRVPKWHDQVTLMSSDVGHLENSTLANYFYGSVLKAKGEEQKDTVLYKKYMEESKKHFHNTNAISPYYPYGYFRLGLLYRYDQYLPDSAYYYFKKAYALNSGLTDVEYQYGRTEYEFGDKTASAIAFAKLYRELPDDTFVIFYHALLQMKTGHPEEGRKINERFLQMAPGYYQSHFNQGVYYQVVNDPANASREFETSIKLGCTDQTVYRYLIDYYRSQGRQAEADNLSKLLQ